MARPTSTSRESVRNSRMSLALTAATYDSIVTLAMIRGVSTNDLVNEILEGVVKKNATAIAEFRKSVTDIQGQLELSFDV